jgi:peptide/nickel transport system ATP-binding protein
LTGAALAIAGLHLEFLLDQRRVPALNDVSLAVGAGEILALVGESGSGKTTVALAASGLLAANARITAGHVLLAGEDVAAASRRRLRALRGTAVATIFQNPRAALNPIRRIGGQIVDAIRTHRGVSRATARRQAIALLEAVRFAYPERIADAYPHELSGGMAQRAMIAIAIACEPRLLIADEPTTGLDATTQHAVMAMLLELVRARGMALLLVTHDLAMAAACADRVAVMRHGAVLETLRAADLSRAAHPYTRSLIAATPGRRSRIEDLLAQPAAPAQPRGNGPLLIVRDLRKSFAGHLAVNGLSFSVAAGESVGLVGESGSGKSTTARLIARLLDKTSGEIIFRGQDIGNIPQHHFHNSPLRQEIQLVFQDPTDSLNPLFSGFAAIADPLRRLLNLRGAALAARVAELADLVHLPQDLLQRRPHQLSGGQKARIGIARAIATNPRLLILDEPTASLDVSVQAAILALLERFKREMGLGYLFVSHDLNVVKMMCDRTIVLQAGRIVEQAPSRTLFETPSEPYTRALLSAIPLTALNGDSFEARPRAPPLDPVKGGAFEIR